MLDYNQELDSNNADYYISITPGLTFVNYKPIKQSSRVILYQKI
jgi:hypothetical protein